jgi:hypothetical protein
MGWKCCLNGGDKNAYRIWTKKPSSKRPLVRERRFVTYGDNLRGWGVGLKHHMFMI